MRLDVPVDPDLETARRWALEELLDPIYHEQESLLQRFLTWVQEQLAQAEVVLADVDPLTAALVAVAVLAVGGGIAFVVAGPVRRARAGNRASTEVFGDDTRTAAELRAAADAAAAQERWADAVLDRFRAVLRSLEERALLDPRPGRTAHEAAEEAGLRLPDAADGLRRAGRLFDDVCYGDARAGRDDDAALRELDQRVAASRPVAAVGPRPADRLELPR